MSDFQVSGAPTREAFLKRLQQSLSLLDLPAASAEPAVDRLLAFCALLLKWNGTLNLTGARSVIDLVEEHLPDAFVLAHLIPKGSRVLDVGSGGGLPALPLAILRPDLDMTLVEPRTKRVAFLRTAMRELGIRGGVSATRVEDWRGELDVALSRATFAPAVWVPLGLGLLKAGGIAYALLNDGWSPEAVAPHTAAGFHTYSLLRGQKRTVAWFVKG